MDLQDIVYAELEEIKEGMQHVITSFEMEHSILRKVVKEYKDDLIVFMGRDTRSAQALADSLFNFNRLAGLKVNLDKSQIYTAGMVTTLVITIDRWNINAELTVRRPKYCKWEPAPQDVHAVNTDGSLCNRVGGVGLDKMFAALPEEEKGVIRDVLRLNLLKIILSFLTLNKEKNVERNHIEAPAIKLPAVDIPTISSSSSATEIRAIVVRVRSKLEEHGKMLLKLDNHEEGNVKEYGKRKKAEPRTWQRDLQQKNQKIEEKKKSKGERQKKTNANKKNKKTEEADVPLKKKVEGTKMKDFTDKQLDHVPLIQLKTLIPKIPNKGLANKALRKKRAEFPELDEFQSTVENLLRQVTPEEGLGVVKDLIVDDDVEVGMEVNLEVIWSEYGGGLLEISSWKKGDKKDDEDDNDEKDVKEKVKFAEEE
ncbi:hypothetical protein GIB67_001194 [Kingdonia uniflora]|uniref:Uncharacterized protein n=1 Tax=Kingdonia uniflora TaxID=39325 RepID=A0A7J7LGD3_9MAGN|nr:hypothetical protein GIB67_001194 [Kingdonia uniflora]